MHPALWKLLGIIVKARLRRLSRSMFTKKGIAYTAVALFFLFAWIASALMGSSNPVTTDPLAVRKIVSTSLFSLWLLGMLATSRDNGLVFGMSEVEQLFPGPYRRRELLIYKIVGLAIALITAALMFSLLMTRSLAAWPSAFLGVYFGLMFLQVVQISVAIFAATVESHAFTRVRKIGFGIVAIAMAAGLWWMMYSDGMQSRSDFLMRLRGSWFGLLVFLPFDIFGRLAAARNLYPDLLLWGGLSILVNAVSIAMLIWVDADFQESAVLNSQRFYDRMRKSRSGAGWYGATTGAVRQLGRPCWMLGAGPIAWRQLQVAVRSSRALLIRLGVMGFFFLVPLWMRRGADVSAAPMLVPLTIISLIYVPQLIRFDFRGDVDHIDTLKTLPISLIATVAGELLVPVVYVTLGQCLTAVAICQWEPSMTPQLLIGALFIVPLNCLVFALENALFLWFPSRLPAAGGIDFQVFGRQMVTTMGKLLVLALAGGLAGGVGLALSWITQGSRVVAIGGAALALALIAAASLQVVGYAYQQFDPSRDTPL